jgi:hypothetical protein
MEMKFMVWKDSGIDENDTGNNEYEGNFWEPILGDVLQGDIIEEPKKGKYNKLFLKVQDSEGTIWITSQHAHLDKQIQKLKIVQGDIVRIKYLGQGEQQPDSEYSAPHLYKMEKWEEE